MFEELIAEEKKSISPILGIYDGFGRICLEINKMGDMVEHLDYIGIKKQLGRLAATCEKTAEDLKIVEVAKENTYKEKYERLDQFTKNLIQKIIDSPNVSRQKQNGESSQIVKELSFTKEEINELLAD